MTRRSPWLNERAETLARILDKHGIDITPGLLDALRGDVSDRLDAVAERMRIGRQAAKMYVTDEMLDDLANAIGMEVRKAQARGMYVVKEPPEKG